MTKYLSVAHTKYTLSHLPFIFVLVFIAGFLWLFGNELFPAWDYNGISFSTLVSFNFFLLATFLVFTRLRDQAILRTPVSVAIKAFIVGSLATLIFMVVLTATSIINVTPLAAGMIVPMIVLQYAVIAPAEELMFRGVLLSYVGIVASALFFALWHWSLTTIMNTGITESVLYQFFFYFAFGIILGIVATQKKWGIPASIGIHATWNVIILGVFII